MKKYINRDIEYQLEKIAKGFPVVMVTGPRQVGKTTLLYHMSEIVNQKINYVSLDDLKMRKQAVDDPELFLNSLETPVIIDEFQYAPNLLSYIKMAVDESRLKALKDKKVQYNGLYYLTGSQLFSTMENISESLAGRVGLLNLYGLSLRETKGLEREDIFLPKLEDLKQRNKIDAINLPQLYSLIFKGGYPELSMEETEREEFFSSYLRTYIERDIRQLIQVEDEMKFIKFIESIAVRTAQELNINDICKEVEISNNTANKWLSIAVSTGIVYLLQPYSNNAVSRIVKTPKIFFMDTGLACYLAGYTDSITLEKSAFSGAIFETFVITEIIKSFVNNGLDTRRYLYYYRDNKGKEIDLLIIYNRTIYPIEIKKSSNPDKSSIKHFDVVQNFGLKVGNGGVVCMTKDLFPIDKENNMIPIELL